VGAKFHPQFDDVVLKHDRAVKLCVLISKYIGRTLVLINKGPYDAAPDRRPGAWRRRGQAGRVKRARQPKGHVTQMFNGLVVCWRCCSAARSLSALERRPCQGIAHEKGHSLWSLDLGRTIFCTRCGCRTTERMKLLKKQCRGAPTPSLEPILANLKRGRIPGKKDDKGRLIDHGRPVPLNSALHPSVGIGPAVAVGRGPGGVMRPLTSQEAAISRLVDEPGILGET
jgi:hypothetical protein